jgi:hypothetical protein
MNQKDYTRMIELQEEILEISALIVLSENKVKKNYLLSEGRSIASELFELTGDPKYKL